MSTVVYYVEVNMICIVILDILLFSLPKGEYQSGQGALYKKMLISTILLCLSDMIAGAFRGQLFTGAREILWISNIVFFISSIIIGAIWIRYSMLILKEEVNKNWIMTIDTIALIICVIVAITPFNGWFFTIDEMNLYHRGPLVFLQWAFMYPSAIVPSIMAFFTKGEKDGKKAVELFVILPALTMLIQILFYGTDVAQTGMVGALLMLYVLLQSKEVNEARLRASLSDELSQKDALTGLFNRRAYEMSIETLKDVDWIGTIFLDLNGLKATNDNLGHKAGDKMLCEFANVLLTCFDESQIFRISGDEFVILCTDSKLYHTQRNSMKSKIGDSAAIGFAHGNGKDLLKLVNIAEKEMYKDKSLYYVKNGIDRRC